MFRPFCTIFDHFFVVNIVTLTYKTPIPKLLFLIKSSIIQPRPTHIPYQCAQFGDDRMSFNVIIDVCDVYHVKGLCPYFGILFLGYY